MPFGSKTYKTNKTKEVIKSQLLTYFETSDYQDKLRLSLRRNAGNRGFLRILFPKIKTYMKLKNGEAKCSMQMEWIGIIMLIAAVGTLLAKLFLPELEGDEEMPIWAPLAFILWYLLYSMISISKIKTELDKVEF